MTSDIQKRSLDLPIAQDLIDLGDLISGVPIPEPIKKTFLDVLSRLCISAVDIPVAYMEGKAAEIRANTDARVKLIGATKDKIEQNLAVPQVTSDRAAHQFSEKILREKRNVSNVVAYAVAEVRKVAQDSPDRVDKTVDQDWLNTFESEACQKSSDDMQFLFGKILAGEICSPSSFSLRTVKLVSQIDTKTAHLFQRFASMAVSTRQAGKFIDSRVISPSVSAAQNGLVKYGFSYVELLLLNECGLISPEFNSQMDFAFCIAKENKVALGIEYLNSLYALVPELETPPPTQLKLHGVMLSSAGTQLLSIVDLQEQPEYTNDLKSVFLAQKLVLTPVRSPHSQKSVDET